MQLCRNEGKHRMLIKRKLICMYQLSQSAPTNKYNSKLKVCVVLEEHAHCIPVTRLCMQYTMQHQHSSHPNSFPTLVLVWKASSSTMLYHHYNHNSAATSAKGQILALRRTRIACTIPQLFFLCETPHARKREMQTHGRSYLKLLHHKSAHVGIFYLEGDADERDDLHNIVLCGVPQK